MKPPEMLQERSFKGGVRWRILALMCGASFVAYILRTNLSIVGDSMIADLRLSQIQLGIILSAFAWGYAIFQFPGGVFGDVLGSRLSITIIAAFWGVLTILSGLVPDSSSFSPVWILVALVAVRFLVGVFQAPIFPIIGGTIANWFPVGNWAFPNGLTSTALTLGGAAAAPLIVWLMEGWGWRASFIVTAPLAFLTAAIWWWYVRDYPRQHRAIGDAERQKIEAHRPPPLSPEEEKTAWKLTIQDRNILLLTASYFCMNYVFYLFFNWFFFYLVDVRNVPEQQAGIFTAAQWIAGSVGAGLGGWLCDRFVKKYGARLGYRLVPVPSLILAAIFLFAGSIAGNSFIAVGFLSLSFGCTQLTEGSYWSATAAVAGRHASAAGGVMNTGGNAVGGIGALLVPITADLFGWVVAVSTGALFALAAAILWLLIRSDVPMRQRQEHPPTVEPSNV